MTINSTERCPYQGLQPYTETDRDFFFGRERDSEIIASNLFASSLTILYGASGVGKSSVLLAGVVPKLKQAPRASVVVFREWQDATFASTLKREMLHALSQVPDRKLLVDPSLPFDEFLFQCTSQLRLTIFFILDQFEEYFLYHLATRGPTGFDAEFARAVNRREIGANFLLSLREDGLSKLDRFQGRIPNLLTNMLRLDHLRKPDAENAIRKPLEEFNRRQPAGREAIVIEDELVSTVIDQVRTGRVLLGEAGRGRLDAQSSAQGNEIRVETPFLQMVMTRLWDESGRSRGNTLGVPLLKVLGGAERIVRTHLDQVMGTDLDREQGDLAARLFRFLVTPTGTKIAHTASDLASYAERPVDRVEEVLNRLCSGTVRILRPVSATPEARVSLRFEIFHDVLASAVVDWSRRRFAALALEEQQQEQKSKAEEAAERERVLQVKLDEQKRKLEAQEFGRRRMLVVLATVLGVGFVLTLGSAFFVFGQRNVALEFAAKASEQAGIAKSQTENARLHVKRAVAGKLAASSLTTRDRQTDLSLLLGLEACEFDDNLESRGSLLSALAVSPHLERFLSGHSQIVWRVAASPDGKTIASASGDRTIRLWDAGTGRVIALLAGHQDQVLCLDFSPDGKVLASGSKDRSVILWDMATRTALGKPLSGFEGAVWDVEFSPDGKLLAAGDGFDPDTSLGDMPRDREFGVRLWEFASRRFKGKLLIPAKFTFHGKQAAPGMITLAFQPRTRILASAGNDGNITFWDIDSLGPSGPRINGAHSEAKKADGSKSTPDINTIAFSPDGQRLFSGGRDGFVRAWDVTKRLPLGERQNLGATVTSLGLAPDGHMLACGSGREISLWNPESMSRTGNPLTGHQTSVESIAFSPDGRSLVSGGGDTKVIQWNVKGRLTLGETLGESRTGWDLAISPDGHLLASVGIGLALWNLTGEKAPEKPRSVHDPETNFISVSFSSNGKFLATGASDGKIVLWSLGGPELSASFHTKVPGIVENVAFSPDDTLLAAGDNEGKVHLWNLADHHETRLGAAREQPRTRFASFRFDLRKPAIKCVAFHPNGKLLAAGDSSGAIVFWDLAASKPVGPRMTEHRGDVFRIAFNRDGSTMASAGADTTIILWDTATHQTLGSPLAGHAGPVYSVDFSPDGKTLASGGGDNTVLLWDVETRQPIGSPLAGRNVPVWTVAFLPDGQGLVSGGFHPEEMKGSSLILWDLRPESWKSRACRIANRNLTAVEWKRFLGENIPYRLTCAELPPGQ